MRSVESSAKTMEEAISLGLEELGVSLADVKIDIIEEGTKGFLGILGSKPAVVRLTVNEEEASDDMLSALSIEENAKAEKKPARKRSEKPKAEKSEKTEKPAKAEKPVKAEKPAKVEKTVEEKQTEEPEQSEMVLLDPETAEGKAQSFLLDVTRLMGVNVTVNARRDEEGNVRVDMYGDTLGILIGRRGETLDALQYLTSLHVNRGQEGYTRVTLDTENYRAKREEALRRLANRMANRAVKTGRKVVMEPMNPYERRILHSALQQNDAVTTHSEGEEPNRHVVITLKQQG
ncbi:MAG: Jag N-terminal domain-containing protein [Clostridia bacterium]|nr:Jag N-terminal domain-containing protein [Clostridia bacterium]